MSGTSVILLLVVLACPVGMGLMMLFMRKGHDHSVDGPKRAGDDGDDRAG